VIATLGRLDVLQQGGKIDSLVDSCTCFSQRLAVALGPSMASGCCRPIPTGCWFAFLTRAAGLGKAVHEVNVRVQNLDQFGFGV
jgi:hypothetical protein